MSVKLLHFADAHIDAVSGGKQNPQTGLSYRVEDFLRSLDSIIDAAISEKADIVLFAGDAYRTANPEPTYQKEWDLRLKRLSDAHIPTLMIYGNHDVTPTFRKAGALQEFDTFRLPYLHLAKGIHLWTPEELDGVPLQVLAMPWIPLNALKAQMEKRDISADHEYMIRSMEEQLQERFEREMASADPDLPVVLLAHYAVAGASYSAARSVVLGGELSLPLSLVKDSRLSYSAMGHIHIFQDMNQGAQPPVVYSGSIEHVNKGEAADDKGYILAEVEPGKTDYRFCRLKTRPMFNIRIESDSVETIQEELRKALPAPDDRADAIISLHVSYPEECEAGIDEKELRMLTKEAFEFQLIRHPQYSGRIRLNEGDGIHRKAPAELLKMYCQSISLAESEKDALVDLSKEIFYE